MNLKEKLAKFNNDDREIKHIFSPGRINLIGEHIDYVGGEVMPAAITLGIDAYASKSDDINVYSVGISEEWTNEKVSINFESGKFEGFMSYIKGIYNVLGKKFGDKVGGINIVMNSTLPLASGLSSSAAFGVLIISAINNLYNLGISNEDKAILFKDVENNFLGLKNGIMDQFAIAVGKENNFIKLNCDTLEYSYFSSELKNKKFLILNSKKPRNLVESKYNERVEELATASDILQKDFKFNCLVELKDQEDEILKSLTDDTLKRRVKHVVTEAKRVDAMANALADDNGQEMGEILNQGHASLRDDYEVSCPELDFIQENIIKLSGVLGARMVGAGFGGCVLTLIDNNFDSKMINDMKSSYKQKFGYEFEDYEVLIGDGTREIK